MQAHGGIINSAILFGKTLGGDHIVNHLYQFGGLGPHGIGINQGGDAVGFGKVEQCGGEGKLVAVDHDTFGAQFGEIVVVATGSFAVAPIAHNRTRPVGLNDDRREGCRFCAAHYPRCVDAIRLKLGQVQIAIEISP